MATEQIKDENNETTKEIIENKVQEICETLTETIKDEIKKLTKEATGANKNCKQLMDELGTFIKEYVSNTDTKLTDDLSVEKTKSLAVISKRLEEVKGRLEAGDLRADDAEMLAIEHGKLKKGREKLIEQL